MHNWKGFLSAIKSYYPSKVEKCDGVYEWTLTSEAFYKTIKMFIKKEDRLLEFGSSTGHISYALAKEGYSITLLDTRKEPVEIAKEIFSKNNVRGTFIWADIYNHHGRYDIAWNSGLLQCYDDNGKEKLIAKMATITDRMILFYPDTENPNKKIGANKYAIPGVGDAEEYSIGRIPELIYSHFTEIYHGILSMSDLRLDYDMYWIYAVKECE